MRREKSKSKIKKFKLLFFIIVLISLIALTTYFSFDFLISDSKLGDEVVFTIAKGEDVSSIVDRLKIEGVIQNKSKFIKQLISSGLDGKIQFGEFTLFENMKDRDVINIITSLDKVKKYKILIKEGQTIRDLAKIVEKEGLFSEEEIINLDANNFVVPFINDKVSTLEGFIFPDTYIIPRVTIDDFIDLVLRNFSLKVNDLITGSSVAKEIGFYNVIILASIIEKEAQLDTERPLVSSVFLNRYRAGMKLESCATINYILDEPKDRLSFEDLNINSPYNTYLNKGFPPSPICNPGLESIMAALYPAESDFFYFVSREDGSHEFSRTYAEHLKAKNKYLKP